MSDDIDQRLVGALERIAAAVESYVSRDSPTHVVIRNEPTAPITAATPPPVVVTAAPKKGRPKKAEPVAAEKQAEVSPEELRAAMLEYVADKGPTGVADAKRLIKEVVGVSQLKEVPAAARGELLAAVQAARFGCV